MINYWWVTRPKRRLNSVPESLSTLTSVALDKIWQGDVDLHLSFESSLEKDGVKIAEADTTNNVTIGKKASVDKKKCC